MAQHCSNCGQFIKKGETLCDRCKKIKGLENLQIELIKKLNRKNAECANLQKRLSTDNYLLETQIWCLEDQIVFLQEDLCDLYMEKKSSSKPSHKKRSWFWLLAIILILIILTIPLPLQSTMTVLSPTPLPPPATPTATPTAKAASTTPVPISSRIKQYTGVGQSLPFKTGDTVVGWAISINGKCIEGRVVLYNSPTDGIVIDGVVNPDSWDIHDERIITINNFN